MTHPGGAPRTVSPPPEECIKLGQDLIKWISEKSEEPRLLLGQWWCIKHKMIRKEWNTLKQRPEFIPYYEEAQQYMALKCLDGTIKEGFAQRYIRYYDRDLKEEENAQAKYISDLKKDAEGTKLSTYNIVVSNDLATGLNLPTSALSNKPDPSSE